MSIYDEIIKVLREKKRILIGSHINPDGDAIGSSLALGMALAKMGKEVVLYNRDGVPNSLPHSALVVTQIPDVAYDAAVLVDCASPERAGLPFENAKISGPKIAIDHHMIDESAVDISCVDETAASAGEVVLRLLKRMNATVDADTAMCIYCTLAVDTGFFRYSNTTEAVLLVASELVGKGADPWTVAKNLEESYPQERFHLLACSLATLEVSKDGKYAHMDVTQKMIKDTGASIEMSDEFASIPRSVGSVVVSALFREVGSGRVKVSLRSKESIDVSAMAKKFGGGGHAHAAGFSISGTLAEAKEKIEALVAEEISKTN
jgi:phosphoesterase RecJ-like protein